MHVQLPDVTDDQSGRSGEHGFFCTAGEGVTPRSYTIQQGMGEMVYFLRYRQKEDSPLILIGRFL